MPRTRSWFKINARFRLAIALVFASIAALVPRDVRSDDALWDVLRSGGAVVLIRHAHAPGTGDPAGFRLGDCSTQRNLSPDGLAHAQRIGAALKTRGVEFDRVLSSPWCRCIDTARAMDVGKVETVAMLASLYFDGSKKEKQVAEIRSYMSGLAANDTVLMSTHNFTISALTGLGTSSGEMIIMTRGPNGEFSVAGRLVIP